MAGEFQNLGVAIKTVYPTKALEPMINEEAPFRMKLPKSVPAGAKVSKGDVKFNGVLALPQNVAQILDGDDLMDAAERSEVQFNLKPTIFTATMNVGWLTRKAANDDKSAWNGGEVRRRTTETVSNLGKFIESTLVGTFGNGIRAYAESSVTGSITLAKPEGTKLVRQGMKISFRDGVTLTAPAHASVDGVRVESVNSDTRVITLSGVADHSVVDADDPLMVVSKTGLTSEVSTTFANGMRGLIDDGTYATSIHGVDRTTVGNEKLKSIVNSNGGTLRNLTEQLLIRTCHKVREESGKRVTDAWCGPGQIEKYIEFVAPERRRAVQGGSYDKSTGYKDDMVHYAPGVAIRLNMSFDVIARELFLLAWDTWFHYQAQEMQWVDDDSLLHLAIGTTVHKASWYAYMASFENIGCDMPVANAVIRDLRAPDIGDVG